MYQKSATGVGTEEQLIQSDRSEIPVHWSRDGRHIVFSRPKATNVPPYDTWILDTSAEKKASPFVESPFDKVHARTSPDGRC